MSRVPPGPDEPEYAALPVHGEFLSKDRAADRDAALQYRIDFERLVHAISTALVNCTPEDCDAGIRSALERMGTFALVDRAYVFLLRLDMALMDNTHEWCAHGIAPQISNLRGIALDTEIPGFAERLRKAEVFHVPDVNKLPPSAAREKEHFLAQGIKSLIVVPMVAAGRVVGALGFDSVRQRALWTEDSIQLLRIVGEMFANVIERCRAAQAMLEGEKRLRGFFEAAFEGIVIHDGGRILDANEAFAGMTGYSVEEMIGRCCEELAAPESRELIRQRSTQKDDSVYEAVGLRKDGTAFLAELRGKSIPFHGRSVRVTAIRDITERKLAEQARQRVEEALKGANADLENRVAVRTDELALKNIELERQIAERREADHQLQQKQRFLEQMLHAHERNRQLVAYEIHDSFLQDVIGALMFVEAYHVRHVTNDPEEAAELDRARNLLRKSIDEARRVISGLRPPIIDEQGIVAGIEFLISEMKQRGIQIDFCHQLQRQRLPSLLEATIFRIVQEALSNIERHSRADCGSVELKQTDGLARLSITDSGVGFDPNSISEGHFGLQGIKERTRLIGGNLEIITAPGRGTRIEVEVPLLDD